MAGQGLLAVLRVFALLLGLRLFSVGVWSEKDVILTALQRRSQWVHTAQTASSGQGQPQDFWALERFRS